MLSFDKDTQYMIFNHHVTQGKIPLEYTLRDRKILRQLAERVSAIASDPVQDEKRKFWKKLNQLDMQRPMVWINEVCWNEMGYEDELVLHTSTEFSRMLESQLIQTLYMWSHMPADMIVGHVMYSPLAVHNSGIGLQIDEDILQSDKTNQIVSHKYHNRLENEESLEMIQNPVIIHDNDRSEDIFAAYQDIFVGVMDVERRGVPGFWFAPWDDLVMLCGAQEVLLNLALKPDFMHKAIQRLIEAYLYTLDQYEELGLLASNNTNFRVGSGAYGYTDELPKAEAFTRKARTTQMWGAAAAQIFSEVSPQMHEEFALRYEKRWLERFALSYYGCCEPLDNKIEILETIENLRKISVSPWCSLERVCEAAGGKYVISYKPSPAVFAMKNWDLDTAKKDLIHSVRTVRSYGCSMEIIMKDISTLNYTPQRLWEWAQMASDVCAGE